MDVARSARLPPSDPLPSQRALHREAQPAALVPQRLPWLLCHREAISRCLPGDSMLTSASQTEKVIQSRMRRYSTAGVLQIPVSRLPSLCCSWFRTTGSKWQPPQVHSGASQQQEYLH